MRIVLDASATVEILLKRKGAQIFCDALSEAEWVEVPHIYISELTNVFWKYHAFEGLPIEKGDQLIAQGMALPDRFADERDYWNECFNLACNLNHSIYDLMYVVLARRNAARLLTNDRKLKQLAKKAGVKTS